MGLGLLVLLLLLSLRAHHGEGEPLVLFRLWLHVGTLPHLVPGYINAIKGINAGDYGYFYLAPALLLHEVVDDPSLIGLFEGG